MQSCTQVNQQRVISEGHQSEKDVKDRSETVFKKAIWNFYSLKKHIAHVLILCASIYLFLFFLKKRQKRKVVGS